MLYCTVAYMDIYVSHNTDQVEALFSSFQLHERVRLKTRERQRKRKRKNRGAKRRREAIPDMNIFHSFTAKGPVALQPLESRPTGVRGMHYALLSRRRMLSPVRNSIRAWTSYSEALTIYSQQYPYWLSSPRLPLTLLTH